MAQRRTSEVDDGVASTAALSRVRVFADEFPSPRTTDHANRRLDTIIPGRKGTSCIHPQFPSSLQDTTTDTGLLMPLLKCFSHRSLCSADGAWKRRQPCPTLGRTNHEQFNRVAGMFSCPVLLDQQQFTFRCCCCWKWRRWRWWWWRCHRSSWELLA